MNCWLSLGLILAMICIPVSRIYAKVYLITEHDGVDHSMLAVIDEQGNLTGFMSKQPALEGDVDEYGIHALDAYDKAQYDKESGILTVRKIGGKILHVNISNPSANAVKDMSCIQLTTDSDMERKIIDNIQSEKRSSNPLDIWVNSNCAVTIESILEKSGYLEKSLWNDFSYSIPGYGQYKVFYAPSILEKSVIKQEEETQKKQKNVGTQDGTGQSSDGETNGNDSRDPDETATADGDSTSSQDGPKAGGDMCYPEDDKPADGDSTFMPGSGDDGGMCYAPQDDYAAEADVTQYPSNDSESWERNVTSGSVTNGRDMFGGLTGYSLPDFGGLMNDFADNAAIVGPNLPYRRILWLFSGESLWDTGLDIFSAASGLFSSDEHNSYISEMKDALQTITGLGN